jgi:hypothetical protein
VTHDLYVFGTNGRDLVEYRRPAGGSWQVVNLTNNVFGDTTTNLPANRVFGAPAAYMLADGSMHVLQVNEEGEVVEYYQLGRGSTFNTQNITLAQAQGQGSSPTSDLPTTEPVKNHPEQIGPQASLLVPDASGLSFKSIGVLQNTRDRASFRFVATHSGVVVVSLQVPFAVLELDAYNPRRRLIHRNRKPVQITDALGQTFYQNQIVLNVVAGQTYYFLVKGMPRSRRHPQPPGFGSFTISSKYVQITDGMVKTVATTTHVPRGPLRGRLHLLHRARLSTQIAQAAPVNSVTKPHPSLRSSP